MALVYHGTSPLAPHHLPAVQAYVNDGFAYWLEVVGGLRALPGLPVRWCVVTHTRGHFLGYISAEDRDKALRALGPSRVRLIHPFSYGLTPEFIVGALLNSQAFRLSVIGNLQAYQLHHNGQRHLPEWELASVLELLRLNFRGGLEAARGAVQPEEATEAPVLPNDVVEFHVTDEKNGIDYTAHGRLRLGAYPEESALPALLALARRVARLHPDVEIGPYTLASLISEATAVVAKVDEELVI